MARKALRQLIKRLPLTEEMTEISSELSSGSDRAAALIGSTIIESSLRLLIISSMRKGISPTELNELFEGEGCLTRFSSCIKVARAFDLLSHFVALDLNWIRDIRNVFAHSQAPVSFTTKEIADACNCLLFKRLAKNDVRPPREIFMASIMYIDIWLIEKANL